MKRYYRRHEHEYLRDDAAIAELTSLRSRLAAAEAENARLREAVRWKEPCQSCVALKETLRCIRKKCSVAQLYNSEAPSVLSRIVEIIESTLSAVPAALSPAPEAGGKE